MSKIFRIPVDNQHFKDTIEEGKSFKEIEKFLSPEEKIQLKRISKDNIIKYWGSIPGEGNKVYFRRLDKDDEVICYRGGKYIGLGKIGFKTINPKLAKYSWGETEVGKTWELMYFFSDVIFIDIDSKVLNSEFSYKDGPVMGFGMISEDKSQKFLEKHQSVQNYIKQYGYEQEIKKIVDEQISKIDIKSPYEAQFYLVDLGNQLEFDTYIPPNDAGRSIQIHNKSQLLNELITIRKDDLADYVAPKIFDTLSNIDVIWFKENYQPKFFYEVVHRSGMTEAFARLKTVADYYDTAKTRIIGAKKDLAVYEKSKRLHFPNKNQICYKFYDDLTNIHAETLRHKQLIESFLA
ncbi:hypothetical protein ACFL14_00365 [Patescibacteria group bacterium]